MKILFIGRKGLPNGKTGDSTQVRRTMACLEEIGHSSDFIGVSFDGFYDSADNRIDELDVSSRIRAADVIHEFLLPQKLRSRFVDLTKGKPIVLSPVYWFDWTRVLLALRNGTSLLGSLRQAWAYFRTSLRAQMDFCDVDVFLPNSYQEGVNVSQHFKTKKSARYIPVVNGFDAPKFDLSKIERPVDVPIEEYIVYPGVFSPRKNQLSFIKATKDLPYHIVFVGGVANEAYFNKCKAYANDRMHFLGFVDSGSPRYWSILAHARCACLASDCETPGIALLEASFAGARPIVTAHGGTNEYYQGVAEYCEPLSITSIYQSVIRGWERGRLDACDRIAFSQYSWGRCVEQTISAYSVVSGGGVL